MSNRVALRAGIPPFYVMDVWLAAAERQRTHGDLVNLSAGQPSAKAPAPVRDARPRARWPSTIWATPSRWAFQNCARRSRRRTPTRYGVEVDPDEVVVTTGSSGGFLLAFLACFDVGDRVAVTSPGYPCYRNILSALGCEVVEVPCGPETRFQPTVEMLAEIGPPIKGVVDRQPGQPDRAPSSRPAELAAIASWCDDVRRATDQRRDLPRSGVSRRAADQLRVGDLARGRSW